MNPVAGRLGILPVCFRRNAESNARISSFPTELLRLAIADGNVNPSNVLLDLHSFALQFHSDDVMEQKTEWC